MRSAADSSSRFALVFNHEGSVFIIASVNPNPVSLHRFTVDYVLPGESSRPSRGPSVNRHVPMIWSPFVLIGFLPPGNSLPGLSPTQLRGQKQKGNHRSTTTRLFRLDVHPVTSR